MMMMNSSYVSLILLTAETASRKLGRHQGYLKVPCFKSVILLNETLLATFLLHLH